jgi:hypothetical protein
MEGHLKAKYTNDPLGTATFREFGESNYKKVYNECAMYKYETDPRKRRRMLNEALNAHWGIKCGDSFDRSVPNTRKGSTNISRTEVIDYPCYFENLDPDLEALYFWTQTRGYYCDINDALLTDDPQTIKELGYLFRAMNRYIVSTPASKSVTLYRGTSIAKKQKLPVDQSKGAEGTIFRQPWYVAASESLDKAREFGELGSPLLEFIVPEGCRNCAKIPYSKHPDEKEWLIPPYTPFEYKSERYEDDGVLIVTFDILDGAQVSSEYESKGLCIRSALIMCDLGRSTAHNASTARGMSTLHDAGTAVLAEPGAGKQRSGGGSGGGNGGGSGGEAGFYAPTDVATAATVGGAVGAAAAAAGAAAVGVGIAAAAAGAAGAAGVGAAGAVGAVGATGSGVAMMHPVMQTLQTAMQSGGSITAMMGAATIGGEGVGVGVGVGIGAGGAAAIGAAGATGGEIIGEIIASGPVGLALFGAGVGLAIGLAYNAVIRAVRAGGGDNTRHAMVRASGERKHTSGLAQAAQDMPVTTQGTPITTAQDAPVTTTTPPASEPLLEVLLWQGEKLHLVTSVPCDGGDWSCVSCASIDTRCSDGMGKNSTQFYRSSKNNVTVCVHCALKEGHLERWVQGD